MFAVNGLLVATMLLCAAVARPTERRLAEELAAVLALVWVFTVLSWSPEIAPAVLMRKAGHPVDPIALWAAVDCAAGMWIAFRAMQFHRIWAAAIFGLLLAQTFLHAAYWAEMMPYASYERALDVLFWSQIAVFLFIGGAGAADRLSHSSRRMRASHRDALDGLAG